MRYTSTVLPAVLLVAGILMPAAGEGQTCNDTITATAPESHFTINNDGTATHKITGLMWMRCSLGQSWDGKTCSGTSASFSWTQALKAAADHIFAGSSDWRLPNKNELESIVEERCFSPAVNAKVFPATPAEYFWSSSPFAGLANGAWSIDLGYGTLNPSVRSGALRVRLVRGGR